MTFRNKRFYLFLAAVQAGLAFSQTQPTYKPDEVTAYLSVDLQAIEKSKVLSTISPDTAKGVSEGREHIRQAMKLVLGIDSQNLVAENAHVMIFGNNLHQAAAVIRGNWTAERANEVLKQAESRVTKLTHGSHPVVVVNAETANSLEGQLASPGKPGEQAVKTLTGDEGYISIHDKGPVLMATGMTTLGRMLDSLDADPVKGDSKFLPADAVPPSLEGRKPLVSLWLRDIPGENGRSNLPGALKGVSAISFALWETEDTLSLAGGISMPTSNDAIKVKTMADGVLMIATSTCDDPDIKSLFGALSTSVVGNNVRVRWDYPIAKLAFFNEKKPLMAVPAPGH